MIQMRHLRSHCCTVLFKIKLVFIWMKSKEEVNGMGKIESNITRRNMLGFLRIIK